MPDETFDVNAQAAAALGWLAQAFSPHAADPAVAAAVPQPETWPLDGGWAWVWRVPGNESLTRPVIIADGFSGGSSKLEDWLPMWAESESDVHHWGTQLHEHGRDVVVLGYKVRNASILDNAKVAIECITTVRDARVGDEPLVVGGLSMGGLVTRYALALMESNVAEYGEHEAATYFSYDSPHRGAWIPISLQCFAHFLAAVADLITDPDKKAQLKAMSALINSPAARQLLWKHTATHLNVGPDFSADGARATFLEELAAVGWWPVIPKTVAVANGRGDGQGLEVTAGVKNLTWTPTLDGWIRSPGATLYAQDEGANKTAAELHKALSAGTTTVKTSDIPPLDGAPGGTLDSFGIAQKQLEEAGYEATVEFPVVCFVPTASAVDLADPSDPFAPVNDMDPAASGVDRFLVAADNEPHTRFTTDLCNWLTAEF